MAWNHTEDSCYLEFMWSKNFALKNLSWTFTDVMMNGNKSLLIISLLPVIFEKFTSINQRFIARINQKCDRQKCHQKCEVRNCDQKVRINQKCEVCRAHKPEVRPITARYLEGSDWSHFWFIEVYFSKLTDINHKVSGLTFFAFIITSPLFNSNYWLQHIFSQWFHAMNSL